MFLRAVVTGAAVSIWTFGSASAGDLPPLPDLQAIAQPATTSVLDEPIEEIAGTTGGCAVLDKDFPGLRQHAMYDFFKSMSLNQIAAMSKGQITADMLTQAKIDITALQTTPPPAAMPASTTTVAASTP